MKVESTEYKALKSIRDSTKPNVGGSLHSKYSPELRKTAVICCGVLERMQLGWMKLEDGTRCMPYIKGHSDENMYRVNNCPSCGKYVRDVMVEP